MFLIFNKFQFLLFLFILVNFFLKKIIISLSFSIFTFTFNKNDTISFFMSINLIFKKHEMEKSPQSNIFLFKNNNSVSTSLIFHTTQTLIFEW